MKKLFTMVLYGAAVTLGSIAATKGVEIASDPHKKAQLKQKIKKIKTTLTEKEES